MFMCLFAIMQMAMARHKLRLNQALNLALERERAVPMMMEKLFEGSKKS